MPWSGGTFTRTNGTYTGSSVWQSDAAAGVDIVDTRHDTHDQDLASGINSTLTKNGTNTPTADLPMGGYKHTNVGDAAALTSYASAGQVQKGSLAYCGTTGGSSNAYTGSLSPAATALTDGMIVYFEANHTNNGAATFNLNSLGAVDITEPDNTALTGGEIVSGAKIALQYDSSSNKWRIMSSHAIAGVVTLTGTQTLTNKTLTSPIISTISNTGTLTLPTSTDTIVGRATTDTLTNKTLTSPTISGGALSGTFTGNPTFSGIPVFSGGPSITTAALDLAVGQIAFPSTQNASSGVNTLDDYEEGNTTGSWTPALSFGGGTTGITYDDRNGQYIKIGRLVIAWGWIDLSSKGSSTGTARITGLPFTQINSGNGLSAGIVYRYDTLNSAAIPGLYLYGEANTTTAIIYRNATGAETSSQQFTDAGIANATNLWVLHVYLASA